MDGDRLSYWVGSSAGYAFADFYALSEMINWYEDTGPRDFHKAYALALLSEIAYEFISQREIDAEGRLKLIPSYSYQAQLRRRVANVPVILAGPEGTEAGFGTFFFETHLFNAIAIVQPSVCFLVFRGTRFFYMSDWKIDINSHLTTAGSKGASPERLWSFRGHFPASNEPMLFHSGFLYEATRLIDLLIDRLKPAWDKNIRTYATGHSLGGALACILYYLYGGRLRFGVPHEDKLSISAAYAYNTPRVTNWALARALGADEPCLYSVLGDIVPMLPPGALGYGSPTTYKFAASFLPRVFDAVRPLHRHSISYLRKLLSKKVRRGGGRLSLLPASPEERQRILGRL